MNCNEWIAQLYLILDKEMEENVWQDVEAHMKLCRPCWDRFEFEMRLKERVKSSCCKESCTESLRLRIVALFEKY